MNDDELILAAKNVQPNAYAPYSQFKVGAALLGDDGSAYTGVNVENASYGITVCAERGAIAKAVSEGCNKFVKIAVYTDCSPPATPCGVCRQMLFEFAPDLQIICANNKNEINRYSMKQLLPEAFRKRGR
ncbi:MAG: cytidine deaminase [candidate division Zixibacteria bacterium]|nr:cytidine deaminase [candidate division Zixibacteria bacterium]